MRKTKKTITILLLLALVISCFSICEVQAASKKKKLRLNKTEVTLRQRQSVRLRVINKGNRKVKWSSTNSNVATVKNGKVTAGFWSGECKIKAKVGKKTLTCNVTVKHNCTSVGQTDRETIPPTTP